jgi:predicted amidophosphoribosyltransferase
MIDPGTIIVALTLLPIILAMISLLKPGAFPEVQRWEEQGKCPACGYDVRWLGACPECGRKRGET